MIRYGIETELRIGDVTYEVLDTVHGRNIEDGITYFKQRAIQFYKTDKIQYLGEIKCLEERDEIKSYIVDNELKNFKSKILDNLTLEK